MSSQQFPRYEDHEMIGCFNCGGDIYQPPVCDDGNAPGRGQFRAHCDKCSMFTWYDVIVPVVDSFMGKLLNA